MKINLLTATPQYFESIFTSSILGRALTQGCFELEILSLRDFASGNLKKQVDDAPYGGGAGMILKPEPIWRALEYLRSKNQLGRSFITSAQGEIFTQSHAREWSHFPTLTLVCGHYEGIDQRVVNFVDGIISMGQFVLTGGEPAAAAMIDATIRLLPGVLGNSDSLSEESFDGDDLEYPQYTRPQTFAGLSVPKILLSGNHSQIAKWRADQRKKIT